MAKKKPAVKPSVKKQKRALKQFEVDKAALTAAAIGTFLLATEVSAAEDAKQTSEQLQDQNLLQAQAELSADLDPAALAVEDALEDLPELTELGADLPLDGEALPELAADLPEQSLDGTQLSQANPNVITAPGVDGKTVMSDAGGAGGGAGNAGAASGTAAGSAGEAGAAAGAGGAAGAGLPGIAAFSSIPAGLVAGGLGLAAVAGAAGGGGGGVGGLAGGLTSVAKGLVVDGNVSGATIFYDANANGKLDAGEISSKTGADGSYTLNGYTTTATGQIVVLAGGVDVLTGQTVGMMITPHGYTNVSPLTTLLAASPGVTEAQLKAKLGLDPSIDLNTYDPLKDMNSDDPAVRAAAEKAFTISQQVYAVLQTAATLKAQGDDQTVDAADITNIAKTLTDSIMSSTGTNSLSILQEATQAAVAVAANGNIALQNSVSAALNNVNSAIQTSYTGLADTLKNGTDAQKAAAVSVAAVSQSALVNAVAAGDTSTLGLLSSSQGLKNLADLYKSGIENNLANGGTGSVVVTAPVNLTIQEVTHTPPSGPYTIVDSASNLEDYLFFVNGPILSDAIGVVATSAGPVLLDQAQYLIARFPAVSFQNQSLEVIGAPHSMALVEATELADHYLKFDASDDQITVEFEDSELNTVVDHALNLGTLGVDILYPMSGELTLTTAQATALVITGHMKFEDSADVTVNVTQGELNTVLTTPGAADALGHAGIDQLGAPGGPLSVTTLQAHDLIAAGLDFADSADVTLGLTTTGGQTHLGTSLNDLQKLGVDHIGMVGGTGDISIDLGTGGLAFGSLPQFASSYHVELNVSASNLQDAISHKADLVGAHIDQLHGDVTLTNSQINTLLGNDSSFNVGTDLGFDADSNVAFQAFVDSDVAFSTQRAEALVALGVDTIDVNGAHGAIALGDASAHAMADAGLVFLADDVITVDASSAGTHMQTSLQQLQHLGVDAITAAGSVAFTVDLGDASQINFNGLPHFQDNDQVTLSFSAADGDAVFEHLGDLRDAGIDTLYVKDSDVLMSLNELELVYDNQLQFSGNNDVTLEVANNADVADIIPDVTDLQLLGVDHLDAFTAVSINDAAARMLTHAGIDFTEDSSVSMGVGGQGTHLSNTLKDLQNLNVDMVTGAMGTDVIVDLGSGMWNTGSLPNFASGLDVTLNAGANQLGQVASHIAGLTSHHIDSIQIHGTVSELAGLDVNDVATAGVDGYTLDVTEADMTGLATLIPNLPSVGDVEVDKIDFAGFSGHASQLHVDANLASAMIQHGLSFEAADHVSLDINAGASGTHFATSADALHTLGVDDVTVHVGDTGHFDLHTLPAFDAALDVTLDVSEVSTGNRPIWDSAAGALLESLGIDNLQINADINSLSSDLLGVYGDPTDGYLDEIHNVMHLGASIDLNGNGNLDAAMDSLLQGLTTEHLTDNYADLINALTESGITEMTVESGSVDVSDSLLGALAESGMLHAVGEDSNIVIDATASGNHLYTTLKDMADLDVDSVNTGATTGNVYINLGALGQNGAMAELKAILDHLDPIIFSGSGTPTLVLDVHTAQAITGSNGVFDSTVMAGLEDIGIHNVAVLVGHNENYVVAQTPVNSPAVTLIGQDMDPTLFDELHQPRH
jgi:hypothetical protein